ncbi:hypothetical protein F5Y09DRAFT_336333 [Xylaria sp. FL1042]|nr:hypothetical protein F5Y09DRAFT_336333 [Xylaria sp. FL1042]
MYSNSRLEKLPPELRIQVLSSMPDLETLRSIINASPIMHIQYLQDRHIILSACLDRELDDFYVDAYANLKSRPIDLGWVRSEETITKFLGSYNDWLIAPNSYPCLKSLPPSRVRWMAAYHISVARPLVRRYGSWALQNLRNEAMPPDAGKSTPNDRHNTELSRSEEVRIFRALYRYETYCHLFGMNRGRYDAEFHCEQISQIFLCLFHPWEAEAIACLYTFFREQWHTVFVEVRDDIRIDHMNWMRCSPVDHEESYDLYEEEHEYTWGMTSRGLKVLMRILAIDNHQDLVSAMERCLMSLPLNHDDSRLELTLTEHCDLKRRDPIDSPHYIPSARDQAERRQDPMSFHGDSSPVDGPPLAWVHAWGGRYANKFGDIMPESLNRCGYVMWDARRWDGMGGREFFINKWRARPNHLQWIKSRLGLTPVGMEMSIDTDETGEQS